ncbi:MAG TPA: hypothetical protein PLS90_10285 [Candidatus Sumerlaeota bacterium]|nr:hypothetical protein [Candidatus Sumerlaeota bacterium]HOR26431.1 hypothetical protein [Candidatus Sumerlaeota bacterium]HPK02830.1 hypothetical protein [Candidatus Sumerlaeota bacterium]
MTLGGWIFMLLSVGGIFVWTVYCFVRVFRARDAREHMHGPLDIDTHDRGT